jgi:hypothetical protein
MDVCTGAVGYLLHLQPDAIPPFPPTSSLRPHHALPPSIYSFSNHVCTGAPPDYFDPNGQNWGFPTYNWEEMAKDGYGWWRRRLAHIAE